MSATPFLRPERDELEPTSDFAPSLVSCDGEVEACRRCNDKGCDCYCHETRQAVLRSDGSLGPICPRCFCRKSGDESVPNVIDTSEFAACEERACPCHAEEVYVEEPPSGTPIPVSALRRHARGPA